MSDASQRWFLRLRPDGDEKGPYTLDQLEESVEAGRIPSDAATRPEGGGEPSTVKDLLEERKSREIRKQAKRARKRRLEDEAGAAEDERERRKPLAGIQLVAAIVSLVAAVVLVAFSRNGVMTITGLVVGVLALVRIVNARKTMSDRK